MEYQPVDYDKLDQITKQKLAMERYQAVKAQQQKEEMLAKAKKEETEHAEKIAALILDYSSNDKGDTLANVHSCEGFQEVYDFKGSNLQRGRLDRKKELIAHNFSAGSHLFQKVYYAKDLLLDDERKLRATFNQARDSYDQ